VRMFSSSLPFAGALQCVAMCCSVLHCVAVYCSVLQRVVVCCSEQVHAWKTGVTVIVTGLSLD